MIRLISPFSSRKLDLSIKAGFSEKRYWILFPAIFLFYANVYPESGFEGDIYCWKEWGKFNLHHGLGHAYNSDSNYLPVYHYILYLFGKLFGSDELIDQKIHYLKLVSFCFDMITCFFMLDLLKEKLKTQIQKSIAIFILLLNPAFVYNSLVWGQVDGIMTCFVFISFCLALKDKIIPSLLFLVLALNFKLQAIIFVPIIILILFPAIKESFSFKKLFLWLLSISAFEIIIILPFILEDTHKSIWKVVANSIDHYPFLSMNAFNFWHLIFYQDLTRLTDTSLFLSLKLKSWGTIIFYLFSLVVLSPILVQYVKAIIGRYNLKIKHEQFILVAGLIPLLFFYFNTQMHERYSHPAIIFLTCYAISSRNYLAFVLTSIAYLLNLESVLGYYSNGWIREFLYQKQFISIIFAISIILVLKDYFRLVKIEFSTKSNQATETQ